MTKEEIKNRILSDDGYLDSIAELLSDIMADEAAKGPEVRWLRNEICYSEERGYHRYCIYSGKTAVKLPPEILAATVAGQVPEAEWWTLDEDGRMELWEKEPYQGNECYVGDDRLAFIYTNIMGQNRKERLV